MHIMCSTTIKFETATTFGGFQFNVTTINRGVNMGEGLSLPIGRPVEKEKRKGKERRKERKKGKKKKLKKEHDFVLIFISRRCQPLFN